MLERFAGQLLSQGLASASWRSSKAKFALHHCTEMPESSSKPTHEGHSHSGSQASKYQLHVSTRKSHRPLALAVGVALQSYCWRPESN